LLTQEGSSGGFESGRRDVCNGAACMLAAETCLGGVSTVPEVRAYVFVLRREPVLVLLENVITLCVCLYLGGC
jgi:hypothetical protein